MTLWPWWKSGGSISITLFRGSDTQWRELEKSLTKLLMAICALAAFTGCGKQTVPEAGNAPASSAGTPSAYAVFAEHETVIDRLEVAFPLAMTAGSSAALVSSGTPEIVSVQSGALVAHRNGRAEIHSPTDLRPLVVLVRAVHLRGPCVARPGMALLGWCHGG